MYIQELSDLANFTRQSTAQSSEKTTYRLGTPTPCTRPWQLTDSHKRYSQAGTFLPTSEIRRQRSRSFVAFPRLHQNLSPSLIRCRGRPASVTDLNLLLWISGKLLSSQNSPIHQAQPSKLRAAARSTALDISVTPSLCLEIFLPKITHCLMPNNPVWHQAHDAS